MVITEVALVKQFLKNRLRYLNLLGPLKYFFVMPSKTDAAKTIYGSGESSAAKAALAYLIF